MSDVPSDSIEEVLLPPPLELKGTSAAVRISFERRPDCNFYVQATIMGEGDRMQGRDIAYFVEYRMLCSFAEWLLAIQSDVSKIDRVISLAEQCPADDVQDAIYRIIFPVPSFARARTDGARGEISGQFAYFLGFPRKMQNENN